MSHEPICMVLNLSVRLWVCMVINPYGYESVCMVCIGPNHHEPICAVVSPSVPSWACLYHHEPGCTVVSLCMVVSLSVQLWFHLYGRVCWVASSLLKTETPVLPLHTLSLYYSILLGICFSSLYFGDVVCTSQVKKYVNNWRLENKHTVLRSQGFFFFFQYW